MKVRRTSMALGLLLCVAAEAHAQAIILPGPTYLPGIYYTSGLGFRYRSGRLTIGGSVGASGIPAFGLFGAGPVIPGAFYPGVLPGAVFPTAFTPGFPLAPAPIPVIPGGVPIVGAPGFGVPLIGYYDTRINIIPQIVVQGRLAGYVDDYDTRGVDLDVLVPGRALGAAGAALAKAEPPPAKVEKPPEPAQADKIRLALVEPALPPNLVEPKNEPVEENARLTALGLAAFEMGEYGLASRRFRQAIDVDPTVARAFFLLAQAHFAMGSFGAAAGAIESGMRRQADWPRSNFHPRSQLFKNHAADWTSQCKLLDELLVKKPKNASLLFLQAHQLWFDGGQPQALKLFRAARPLFADPAFADAFLQAAAPKVVAAQ